MSRKYLVALMLGAATLAAVSQFSLAQPDPNGPPAGQGPQGPGGPGGPGGGPGGMQGGRERMMEQLRDELDIADDAAWDALALKIDKVLEAQREARTPGMGRGPGGPGGPGMGPPGQDGGQRGQRGGQRGPRGGDNGGGPGAGGPPDGGQPGAGGPPGDGGGQRQRGQRGGGQGAGGPQGEPSPVMHAARELRELVGENDAKAEDIVAKLKAYREAKAAADAKLVAARAELKAAATDARTEAVLVLRGLLE